VRNYCSIFITAVGSSKLPNINSAQLLLSVSIIYIFQLLQTIRDTNSAKTNLQQTVGGWTLVLTGQTGVGKSVCPSLRFSSLKFLYQMVKLSLGSSSLSSIVSSLHLFDP
jgi:hypothetical protein